MDVLQQPMPYLLAAAALLLAFGKAFRSHFQRPQAHQPVGLRILEVVFAAAVLIDGGLLLPASSLASGVAAWSLLLLSGALFLWTLRATRHDRLPLAFSPDAPQFLLRSGPYRHIRHPFYASYILFFAAHVAAFPCFATVLVLASIFALYSIAARAEEQRFAARPFSSGSAVYASRVGCLFPALGCLGRFPFGLRAGFARAATNVEHEKTRRAGSTECRLKQLYTPRTGRFLRLAAQDWGLIVLACVLVGLTGSLLVLTAAMIVIGTRQHALAVLGHDGTHFLVSRNRRWNDWITQVLCFWPIGVSLSGYRAFHARHHRHLGGPRDPERRHKAGPLYDGSGRPRDLYWRTLCGLLGLELGRVARLILAVRPTKRIETIQLLGFQIAATATLLALGLPWVLGLWWSCLFTTFWAAFSVREWAEHVGITGTHRLAVPRFLRGLCYPHNTHMHYEHHRAPWVPCWRLPEARALEHDPPIIDWTMLVREQLRGAPTGGDHSFGISFDLAPRSTAIPKAMVTAKAGSRHHPTGIALCIEPSPEALPMDLPVALETPVMARLRRRTCAGDRSNT